MTLLLVRHAVALRRSDWKRPDDLRPLTPRGYEQAERLGDVLAAYGVERILSSPSTRCIETVQPLAARLGLPVEEMPQLAEGRGTSAAPLLEDVRGTTVVCCTHGDVLPELLAVLAPSAHGPCEKGSTWVVGSGGAEYLPPPD